jgi:hypothetical protein
VAGCADFLGFDGDARYSLESSVPEPGATSVSVLSPISLRFSAPVAVSTVHETITLRRGESLISGGLSLSDDQTVVFTPDDPLDFGTDFQVAVSETLLSRSGVPLPAPETWSFRTEGLPPPTPNQDSLEAHLRILAHDSMAGRGSGTVAEMRAAEYLRDRFIDYGLQPAPGGALQPFETINPRTSSVLNSQNVLAVVEGAGELAEEWVVVGAHYDHLGIRAPNGGIPTVYNGADDNGSGTVTILEMARLLQKYVDDDGMASKPRRSVLFAAFGAEEVGLLGSCYYVHEDPAVPLSMTKAMLNFDMVGRLRENTVYLSGFETSAAWSVLAINSNAPSLLLSPRQSCTGCTDHACFWQVGIPFMGFFTGTHAEYHRPGDDVETINFQGLGSIGELALRSLVRLLVMPQSPPFSG